MEQVQSGTSSADSPRDRRLLEERAAHLFNEGVMGFLALVALATALGPMVFDVGTQAEHVLTVIEWVLVGSFAAEFCVHGWLAPDFGKWLRSPWRILDAVTVLGPVVALLPQVSDLARGSLMLRVLRMGRAFAFGTRASSAAVRSASSVGADRGATTPDVTMIRSEHDLQLVKSDWATLLAWTERPGGAWFHATRLSRDHFHRLASVAGVQEHELRRWLATDDDARIRQDKCWSTLCVQLPEMENAASFRIHRDRVVAIITTTGVLTATTGSLDLQDAIIPEIKPSSTTAFPVRVAVALLVLARERNAAIVERLEAETRRLEDLEGGQTLLREAFNLRTQLSAAALDLWRLTRVVRALADGKTVICEVDLRNDKHLDELLAETEALHDAVNRMKEALKSLIEFHINMKSFQMNKFLKLLAVVSFLGLIPSVAGGLLGMNVAGNPWSVTLGQVAFCVAMGMSAALYVFAVRGWLK
jgi:Mg2+ and Co2+ transporter CorA